LKLEKALLAWAQTVVFTVLDDEYVESLARGLMVHLGEERAACWQSQPMMATAPSAIAALVTLDVVLITSTLGDSQPEAFLPPTQAASTLLVDFVATLIGKATDYSYPESDMTYHKGWHGATQVDGRRGVLVQLTLDADRAINLRCKQIAVNHNLFGRLGAGQGENDARLHPAIIAARDDDFIKWFQKENIASASIEAAIQVAQPIVDATSEDGICLVSRRLRRGARVPPKSKKTRAAFRAAVGRSPDHLSGPSWPRPRPGISGVAFERRLGKCQVSQ
jgi:hypothetical protein